MDQKRGGYQYETRIAYWQNAPYCSVGSVGSVGPVLLLLLLLLLLLIGGGYQYETRIGNTPCTGGWPAVGRRSAGGWPAVGRLGPEY